MSDFQVAQTDRQGVVTLEGSLTAGLVPALQAAVKDTLAKGVDYLVFDLAKTAMLDSSGMGLLIAAGNSMARLHGGIRVINASPDILQLLQSMRLADRLHVSGRAEQEARRG